jgi:hypothetical protein
MSHRMLNIIEEYSPVCQCDGTVVCRCLQGQVVRTFRSRSQNNKLVYEVLPHEWEKRDRG